MLKEYDLERLTFDLNEAQPIHVILRNHDQLNESYFDMHYEFEIGIVIKGRMKREYFDYQMDIGPGDVWFCGMWEPHGFELLETPCELVVLVIDPKYLMHNNVLNQNTSLPFQASPKLRPKTHENNRHQLLELAHKLKQQVQSSGHTDWYKLYFFELLLILTENWKAPTFTEKIKTNESIQQALKLVFEKKRLITTEEAAIACHMSVSKFRTTFKMLMHSSFSEFALKYRVRGAMSQLKNSKETQEVVAFQWGFTDASHLHKCFKKLE